MSATPGGVTSRHLPVARSWASNCQNRPPTLGPPVRTVAQLAPGPEAPAASGTATGPAASADCETARDEAAQPAIATATASRTAAKATVRTDRPTG